MAKKKRVKVEESKELAVQEPKDPNRFLPIPEKERTLEQIIGDPMTIQTICDNVVEGGSLVSLAKLWQVPYSKLIKWVRADDAREKAYEQALRDRDEWTKETLLIELRMLTVSDLREAFDDSGKLKHPKEWPDSFAKVVGSLEVFEEFMGTGDNREYIGDTKKLKMWDKLKAIELIGKTIAAFKDKTEHSGTMTLEQLLLGSYTPEELAGGKHGS